MNTQKSRLLEFISFLNVSVRSFERTIGVSQSSIANCKDKLSEKIITASCAEYPILNKVWLLSGVGTMLNSNDQVININDGGTAIQGGGSHNTIYGINPEYESRMRELAKENKSLREQLHAREIEIARLEGKIEVLTQNKT